MIINHETSLVLEPTVTGRPTQSPAVPHHPLQSLNSPLLCRTSKRQKTAVQHFDRPGLTTDSRPVTSRALGSPTTGPPDSWEHRWCPCLPALDSRGYKPARATLNYQDRWRNCMRIMKALELLQG